MPSIQLTDQFGLDATVEPAPRSALRKYFQQIPSLRFDNLDLSKIGGLTLDEPAIQSLNTGLSFQNPVNMGDGTPTLSVAAGAHASVEIITDTDDLPGYDGTETLGDSCYVSFGIEATAGPVITIPSGALALGISPSTNVKFASYFRFPRKAGITIFQAVQQTVANFAIPLHSADLDDLAAGQISKVAVIGKLQVSGTADLLATTNPLASAALPAPLPTVSVSAGGSATIGVSCEIETEYEVIVRKLDTGAVRFEWRHKNGAGVTVSANVSEGITAGVGTTDLFSVLIGLVSASPEADLKELSAAGVPHEQAEAIQSAVKAAISRKLSIAVCAAVTAHDSQGPAFIYEIVPTALTDASRVAVDQALRGNLTGLHTPGLPGVSSVRSIWDDLRKVGVELDVNLLGILNYRSVTTLALEGKVMYEPATGSLVITDRASAQRIQSTQVNFGADIDKLRHVLAESFFITAAYRCARQLPGAPSLCCSHTFFDLQDKTSRADMNRKLQTGVALALLSLEEAGLPDGIADFGRTLFTVSTEYDEDLVTRMFVDTNESPLPHEWYETVGRNAIQFLVQPGDDDALRRQPAIDDLLWSRMKEVGQPGFSTIFAGIAAPLLGAITADYSTIQWWADAMFSTAQQLATVRLWLARNTGATSDDPEFQKLRQDLAAYLRQVAANTREEFGQPWGLIAMRQLVARGGAKLLITSPHLVLNKSRALAAVTGP